MTARLRETLEAAVNLVDDTDSVRRSLGTLRAGADVVTQPPRAVEGQVYERVGLPLHRRYGLFDGIFPAVQADFNGAVGVLKI